MVPANAVNNPNPWNLLRYGDAEAGLAVIREACARQSTASHIMELGIAYLWTGDYQSAFTHFNEAIHQYPRSMSGFYGMAGAAQWCMGQYSGAVDGWNRGLKAEYADAAGLGIQLPLLLFLASRLDPEVFPKKKAEGMLVEKAKDLRAGHWPGSLARFVLGQSSSEDALDSIPEGGSFGKKLGLWWIQFYGHLLELDAGILTSVEFAQLMKGLTDTSQPLFSDQDDFLSVLWSEEFFIARHIAQMKIRPPAA
jgi:tetratricopeptide (TPR) repeat protein